jgi:hypothetical protein
MSYHPWEPDRLLSVEIARSVIRAAFPRVDVTRVEFVGSGWEFDVFVTADGWAFRFPRRAEYQSLLDREGPVLALARSVLPPETAVPWSSSPVPRRSISPMRSRDTGTSKALRQTPSPKPAC